jgi:hypothetical protein
MPGEGVIVFKIFNGKCLIDRKGGIFLFTGPLL